MANALAGVSVLIVEDDADTLDLLALGLSAVGANVKTAMSAEVALATLETWRPNVILSDLELPGVDGYKFLELLRANPRLRMIPAAALSGTFGKPRDHVPHATFEKHLAKPSKLPEIVMALAQLFQQDRPEVPAERPSGKLRDLLARLNAASGCRYTSLLRFSDHDTLSSIWTYDRIHPRIDPFPLGLPVHVSDCVLLRETGKELGGYVGVPLVRTDGSMFGTVCCYDEKPRAIDAATRTKLTAAARALEPALVELFADADDDDHETG